MRFRLWLVARTLVSRGGGRERGKGRELTLEIALLRVGFGAVLLEPKRRFILMY